MPRQFVRNDSIAERERNFFMSLLDNARVRKDQKFLGVLEVPEASLNDVRAMLQQWIGSHEQSNHKKLRHDGQPVLNPDEDTSNKVGLKKWVASTGSRIRFVDDRRRQSHRFGVQYFHPRIEDAKIIENEGFLATLTGSLDHETKKYTLWITLDYLYRGKHGNIARTRPRIYTDILKKIPEASCIEDDANSKALRHPLLKPLLHFNTICNELPLMPPSQPSKPSYRGAGMAEAIQRLRSELEKFKKLCASIVAPRLGNGSLFPEGTTIGKENSVHIQHVPDDPTVEQADASVDSELRQNGLFQDGDSEQDGFKAVCSSISPDETASPAMDCHNIPMRRWRDAFAPEDSPAATPVLPSESTNP